MGRDLGSKIRKLRQQKGLSQCELAQKTGIAQSTLSYLESGKKMPQFDTLSAICKGLGVSVLELLIYDEPKSAQKWPLQQMLHTAHGEPMASVVQSLSPELLKQFYEQKYLKPQAGFWGSPS